MKKYLGILLTLVLVVSLSVVPAVVSANPGVVELQTAGDGMAEWTTAEKMVGDYSVLLNSGTGFDVANAARVAVPYNDTVASISSISFWMNIKSATPESLSGFWWHDGIPGEVKDGYIGAYILLELDKDGDSVADDWLVLVEYAEASINTWVERSLAAGFHTGTALPGTPTGQGYWHSVFSGDLKDWDDPVAEFLPLKIGTLQQWQGTDLSTATVLKVKIAVGEWAGHPNVEAYIDDITINDVPYVLEPVTDSLDMIASYTLPPPPQIGISVTPLEVDFGSVTPGVSSQSKAVTVTNTGDVAEDFSASLQNELPPGVYTTGLTIDGALTKDWSKLNVPPVSGKAVPPLILTVPIGTPAGTYTATLVFWAEMAD